MIGYINGKVLMRGDKFIIIETNGVGYKIFVSPEALKKTKGKENASFFTHLHVREIALELYGFMEYPELDLFELLISISGIGPKSALGIIGVAPIDTLKQAISSGETSYLTKVSGIGKKNAEKIIIELREKLGRNEFLEGRNELLKDEQDVLAALESLGYSLRDAREALKNVPPEITGAQNRIKYTLKQLGK